MNVNNSLKKQTTPISFNFPSSIQKQRFIFTNSSFEKQSDCLSSPKPFTFNPSKSRKFTEDISSNSQKKNAWTDSNHNKKDTKKPELLLLDSTTVGDSFKKSTYSDSKKLQVSLLNPFKTANLSFKFREIQTNGKPTETPNEFPKTEFKQRHSVRTQSLNFREPGIVFKIQKPFKNGDVLADKINRLQNDNNSGQKVLNVALSKNYILNYKKMEVNKNQKDDFEKKERKPETNGTGKLNMDCSFKLEETILSSEPFSVFGKSTVDLELPFQNSNSQKTPLIKWLPQTLTNFCQKRISRSIAQKTPLKPKVFDFCKAIESNNMRLTSETASLPFLPFFTKPKGDCSSNNRGSPIAKN